MRGGVGLSVRANPFNILGPGAIASCPRQLQVLAEREGFEPSVQVLARTTV
jgi:hypothetical protein